MQLHLLVVSLALATIAANPVLIQPRVTESDEPAYRLSGRIIPSHYDVDLVFTDNVFLQGNTAFQGTVAITFTVTEPIGNIEIHAPSVPSNIELRTTVAGSELITISQPGVLNDTSSILNIVLENDVLLTNVSTTYLLTIDYNAELNPINMTGAYLSYYKTTEGANKYLVTTQFQPDSARKAFPCFDEPEFKATFNFSIEYPAEVGLNALFNTREIETVTVANTSHVITTFDTTPRMSTYLIAFVVSEFTCDSLGDIEEGVPHRICSRTDVQSDREHANQWGPRIMQALEVKTGIKYSEYMDKIDQIAIPDFSAGAMENWGLVTYRERLLLWNSAESTASNKESIVTIIAHEFAHMWFGNLVTTKWWNTLFLNEGFASYYEYFGPASIEELEVNEQWELTKRFVIDQQQSVFVTDSYLSSQALSSQASSPSEIWGKFGSISYLKGASVIRMVRNFLRDESFNNGIHHYLDVNRLQAAQPWNLWQALQVHAPEGVLPTGLTLEDVMANWVNESGYPVVTANLIGDDVYLSQKRFLYSGESDTQWYVPISYTTSDNTSNFQDVSATDWLHPGNYLLKLSNVVPNNNWIILNNQESAYYRVNYDDTLWDRIKSALETDPGSIHVLNRAQIVDDAINLARAQLISYSRAIGLLDYIRNETEYYPIYSALNGLDFLTRTFGDSSEIGTGINSLQLQILQKVRGEVSFELDADNHIGIRRAVLVLGRVCRLGETSCINESKNRFAAFRVNGTNIDPNLRSLVYCNALRHSDDIQVDWQHLWSRFETTDVATEQVLILSALGCTKDEDLLRTFLEHSLNDNGPIRHQDISTVWSSVITSNPEGVIVAINFFKEHHPRIANRFSESISVLLTAASRATTIEHINALQEFSQTANLPAAIQAVADSALLTAQSNVAWAEAREAELKELFVSFGCRIEVTWMVLVVSLIAMLFR